MDLSKREKLVALAALGAVFILLFDYYAVSPALSAFEEARSERAELEAEMAEAEALFSRQRVQANRWNRMVESGMRRSPEEAESAMFRAVRDWSRESGLSLSSLNPGRSNEVGDMVELNFQVTGSGGMRSVARFLWLVENAELPVKVEQLQVTARRDGVDDLSLQVSLSSVCMPPSVAQE